MQISTDRVTTQSGAGTGTVARHFIKTFDEFFNKVNMTRSREVVTRQAHNLKIGGANPSSATNMNKDQFIIELPFINFDKSALLSYMVLDNNWINEGYQNLYLRPKNNMLFSQIHSQVEEFNLDIGKTFYAMLQPFQKLNIHTDKNRTASINIPLQGNFENSPITFYSENNEQIYRHHYDTQVATVINTSIRHSVINRSNAYRYILCLSLYLPWEDIQSISKKYIGV